MALLYFQAGKVSTLGVGNSQVMEEYVLLLENVAVENTFSTIYPFSVLYLQSLSLMVTVALV